MRGDLCLGSATVVPRRSGRKIALILLAATALNVAAGTSEFEFNLTHGKPASKWTESLPLDNEQIGATVFARPEVAAKSTKHARGWRSARLHESQGLTPSLIRFGS